MKIARPDKTLNFSMTPNDKYPWFKIKGYLHLTPKVGDNREAAAIIQKVTNAKFVSKYAFYPLIHSVISERRFKKINIETNKRAHSIKSEGKVIKKNVKKRPLHYATHLDSLIFGYYTYLLSKSYEEELGKNKELSKCITAYRKIPIDDNCNNKKNKNKGTIHFAKEVFDEIERRSKDGCVVMKLDIESFFNRMSHELIWNSWEKLFSENGRLPADHYNVFKAATRFSYILLDDFRHNASKYKSKRTGFNEKQLALIRNKTGKHSFFESASDFRSAIKEGRIHIHRFPFRHKGKVVGIPQGLPISSVLANLYLLEFDKHVWKTIVCDGGGFYRRYSDDIIVICESNKFEAIKQFVYDEIERSEVSISKEKTETFYFRQIPSGKNKGKVQSIKFSTQRSQLGLPLTYLGFEYYGDRIAIKSANLAKFYRRMIAAIKRKARRALEASTKKPEVSLVIYKNQLHGLFMLRSLSQKKVTLRRKWLRKNDRGEYSLISKKKSKKIKSNYLSYVFDAARIMNQPTIERQIRNHKKIFGLAVTKQLKRIKNNLLTSCF